VPLAGIVAGDKANSADAGGTSIGGSRQGVLKDNKRRQITFGLAGISGDATADMDGQLMFKGDTYHYAGERAGIRPLTALLGTVCQRWRAFPSGRT